MIGFNTTIQGDLEAGLGFVLLMTGTSFPASVIRYVRPLLRAGSSDTALPDVPPPIELERIPEARTYAGIFTAGYERVAVYPAKKSLSTTRIASEQQGGYRLSTYQ